MLTQKSISDEDLLTAITKAAFCESDRNAFLNKNQRHQHNTPSKKVYETGVRHNFDNKNKVSGHTPNYEKLASAFESLSTLLSSFQAELSNMRESKYVRNVILKKM